MKRPFPNKVFDHLSKHELQSFLEILHNALESETEEDVMHVLLQVKKIVPFDRLIAGLLRVGSTTGAQQFSKVVNISFPAEWLQTYAQNKYFEVDPVLLSHLRSFSTQVWEEAYKDASTKREHEFIEHAKSFGLVDGVTAGSFDPRRGVGSFFSFAGDARGEGVRYAAILEYLVHHLHHALVKSALAPTLNRVSRLSPRETGVIKWMRMGKPNWEISRILGVSERTVRFHAESIFNKLDVTSRTRAVALAMEDGLLSPA